GRIPTCHIAIGETVYSPIHTIKESLYFIFINIFYFFLAILHKKALNILELRKKSYLCTRNPQGLAIQTKRCGSSVG
ncbi:MAG TPA: hypothetical protein VJY12_08215, partial [Dysgonamonadaceae bacterium]|nr:hypothetical protein [Dysgonamonadaceae bacterium]